MVITKLILYKYKRLFLGDIETLILTPENKLSLILGRNGIGKSSLLLQLTPLPANLTKDFKNGGYKEIHISHESNKYVLISGLNGSKKHSFIKDTIELNDGGTLRVQTELVREHFNITPNINNILLGLNKFTLMSPNERKKWITEISNIDYTYPIYIYNTLKQRNRDISGGIKLLISNISKIELDLLDDSEVTKINKDIEYLSKFIDYLLTLISHLPDEISNPDSIIANLTIANSTIYKILSGSEEVKDIDDTTIVKKIAIIDTQLDATQKKIDSINKTLVEMDNVKIVNSDESGIREEHTKLLSMLNSITLPLPITLEEIDNNIEEFRNLYSELISLVSELQELNEVDSRDEALGVVNSKLSKLTFSINNLDKLIVKTTTELEGYKKLLDDDNKITCGNCGNAWFNKYDDAKVKELEISLPTITAKVQTLREEYTTYEKKLSQITRKLRLVTDLKNIVYDHKDLKPIWTYLFEDVTLHNNNDNLYHKINNVSTGLLVYDKALTIHNRIKLVESELKEIELYKSAEVKFNLSNKSKLMEELEEITITKSKLLIEKERLHKLHKIRILYDKTITNIKINISTWYETKNFYYVRLRNKYLKQLINTLKEQMIELTNRLNNNVTVNTRILKDKKLLEDYKLANEALTILLKELSPSEGLIAKSINSFLNIFLEDINTVINSIWSYEIKILPCDIGDDNDLNYKFKVLVDNKEIIDDISKVSSSMQEIIDLAFRIMFMKYLGLSTAPLMLDEFGRTFDVEHRITAYNAINRILASDFDQIFMVSHFESNYGFLKNVDTCVLSDSGVELTHTDTYNTTLKLL